MSLLSHLFADISFLEAAMALVALGLAERLVILLPETVVGENGWLLRMRSAQS